LRAAAASSIALATEGSARIAAISLSVASGCYSFISCILTSVIAFRVASYFDEETVVPELGLVDAVESFTTTMPSSALTPVFFVSPPVCTAGVAFGAAGCDAGLSGTGENCVY
jgi:hypothetical protein|tara:strand:+ start:1296 stop:1634 length:339 start_codon:yes stop_codon:yes gene_type:complete